MNSVQGTISDTNLKIMHAVAGSFHLIQGIYGETIVNTLFKNAEKFTLKNPVFNKNIEIGKYNLAQMAPIFSFLSSVNHIWAVVDSPRYFQWVEKGYNPVRWIEYSMSAGIMYYMIAALSGIVDIKTLTLLVISNVALQYTGYSIEKDSANAILQNNERSYDSATRQQVIGFLIFFAQVACIWTGFFTSLSTSEQDVPVMVWLIIFIITALFLSFGLLSLAYTRGYLKKKNLSERDFRKIETGYIVLSFVAKTFLMNMVLFGSVNNSENQQ